MPTSPAHLRRLALVLAVAAALLAGCGGSSGSTAGSGGATTAGTSGGGDASGAYGGGYAICTQGTVAEIASLYGIEKATPAAVAEAIAEALSGGRSKDAADAMRGCLDAFSAQK